MSLRFKTNLLEHTKAVGRWAARRGARAQVDTLDLSLHVQHGERRARLLPQFVGKRDGERLVYFDVADRHAQGFVGWLPYSVQAWEVSRSKQVFKQRAAAAGVPTPRTWAGRGDIDAPFLVKRDSGAFGYGMRGPFSAAAAASVVVAEGEYIEAFVMGHIARAWYWCGQLTVLELFGMPELQGDGRSSAAELLRQAGAGDDLPQLSPLLQLQGIAPDAVPAAGQRFTADYRYVSPLNPTVYANSNRLPQLKGSPVADRFADAGQRVWQQLLPHTMQLGFVLDAIVDAQGNPWFLEINSNAQGHPDTYATMLDGLFGAPSSVQTQAAAA